MRNGSTRQQSISKWGKRLWGVAMSAIGVGICVTLAILFLSVDFLTKELQAMLMAASLIMIGAIFYLLRKYLNSLEETDE